MSESLALSWWTGRNVGWLRRESDDLEIDLLSDRFHEPAGIDERDIYAPGEWS
jgi:hypothetical protein